MPTLTIDEQLVEVEVGTTLVDAAAELGIEIPTLCFRKGNDPCPSCMVCLVKDQHKNQFVPSCGTVAEDDMEIESETPEVHEARKAAIELLLSDHLGDCMSPCHRVCPAHMNIPRTLRQIRSGELRKAMATIKQEIALPAILGRLCHKPCESGCRRSMHDDGVSICMLVRHAADADLASGAPYQPSPGRPKKKSVAIIGAGPAGLSAAYYLLLDGYPCTLIDRRAEPGGSLLEEIESGELPREVFDAEIGTLQDLGAQFQLERKIDQQAFGKVQEEFDAVLIAAGVVDENAEDWLGLEVGRAGIVADRDTLETPVKGVFAAGHAIRKTGKVVHAIADGKSAATSISQYLSEFHVLGPPRPFTCQVGKLKENEMDEFLVEVNTGERLKPARGQGAGFDLEEALQEAERCVHCDCHAADTCKLRELAQRYGATQTRYGSERPRFERQAEHPFVIFEPGKCIRCGNCIRVAEAAKESLGLTFVGRGFDVKLGVPFSGSMSDGLQRVAAEAVAACPVGALVLKKPEAGADGHCR